MKDTGHIGRDIIVYSIGEKKCIKQFFCRFKQSSHY